MEWLHYSADRGKLYESKADLAAEDGRMTAGGRGTAVFLIGSFVPMPVGLREPIRGDGADSVSVQRTSFFHPEYEVKGVQISDPGTIREAVRYLNGLWVVRKFGSATPAGSGDYQYTVSVCSPGGQDLLAVYADNRQITVLTGKNDHVYRIIGGKNVLADLDRIFGNPTP